MMDDQADEIDTALLHAIGGDADEYLVLANWNTVPVEPEDINGCVVSVRSNEQAMEVTVPFSIATWVFVMRRLAPDSFLLGTADGELIRVQGETSEIVDTGIGSGIHDIWGAADDDCWLAHGEGLAHWKGGRIDDNVVAGDIHTIHGVGTDFAVAVGAQGTVLRFDGKQWHEVTSSPTNKRLIGVHCVSANEIYISGWNGALYRWDGKERWQQILVEDEDGPVDESVSSPIAFQGQVYVCVSGLGVFKIVGERTELLRHSLCSRAAVINNKLILTGWTTLAEYDGTHWEQIDIKLPL